MWGDYVRMDPAGYWTMRMKYEWVNSYNYMNWLWIPNILLNVIIRILNGVWLRMNLEIKYGNGITYESAIDNIKNECGGYRGVLIFTHVCL